MTWLLIITLSFDGQTAKLPVGVMSDEPMCTMAGAGIELFLEQGTPGLDAAWSCAPMLEGEAA